jgi:hypothetical protein
LLHYVLTAEDEYFWTVCIWQFELVYWALCLLSDDLCTLGCEGRLGKAYIEITATKGGGQPALTKQT